MPTGRSKQLSCKGAAILLLLHFPDSAFQGLRATSRSLLCPHRGPAGTCSCKANASRGLPTSYCSHIQLAAELR